MLEGYGPQRHDSAAGGSQRGEHAGPLCVLRVHAVLAQRRPATRRCPAKHGVAHAHAGNRHALTTVLCVPYGHGNEPVRRSSGQRRAPP